MDVRSRSGLKIKAKFYSAHERDNPGSRLRVRFRWPLQCAEWQFINFVNDLGVCARGRLQSRPWYGVRRLLVSVEIVEELTGRDTGQEAPELAQVARRWPSVGIEIQGRTELPKCLGGDSLEFRARWPTCIPLLCQGRVRPNDVALLLLVTRANVGLQRGGVFRN